MSEPELSEEVWDRLVQIVPGGRKGKRGPRSDSRRFILAVLWKVRTGASWNELPARYGNFRTVKTRYYRWRRAGLTTRLFALLTEEPGFEWLEPDAVETARPARRRSDG